MKKMIPLGLVIALLTTTTSSTNAQLAFNNKKFRPEYFSGPNSVAKPYGSKDAIHAHPKATRAFLTSFENATDVRWSGLDNGKSLVHFFSDGIETKIFYSKKGNLLATIRYYREDELPAEVRHLVRTAYYDFSIFLVIEVTVRNQTAYLVKIEDNTHIKTIRVMDGAMDEIEALEKR